MDVVPEITRESIKNLIVNGKREDGRLLDEYRDISIETDVISKAEGSARVKIGGTQVLVGVKPQIGSPFPDTPNFVTYDVDALLNEVNVSFIFLIKRALGT